MFDLTPQPWMTKAECAKEEYEYLRDDWHDVGSVGGGDEKTARRAELLLICQSCPVMALCRQYADDTEPIDRRTVHGIYGGETAPQRLTRRAKGRVQHRPPKPPPDLASIKHGTSKGYQREQQFGLNHCTACRAAEADRVRDYRERRAGATT